MTHELKSWPGTFEAVANDSKKHEVRKNDRPFAVNDSIILREFTPEIDEHGARYQDDGHTAGTYTGRTLLRLITYISPPGSFGLPLDLCVLSLGKASEHPRR